jgi:hypothetical protein
MADNVGFRYFRTNGAGLERPVKSFNDDRDGESVLGQSRHFDRAPATSGLPR